MIVFIAVVKIRKKAGKKTIYFFILQQYIAVFQGEWGSIIYTIHPLNLDSISLHILVSQRQISCPGGTINSNSIFIVLLQTATANMENTSKHGNAANPTPTFRKIKN